MGNDALPRIFRLKRKFNEDPLEKLSLSIKKSRKDGGFETEVITDLLQLKKSCCEPVTVDFQNATYHDLDVIDTSTAVRKSESPTKASASTIFDVDCCPFQNDDILDEVSVSTPSSSSSNERSMITCNGHPMIRAKRIRKCSTNENTDTVRPLEVCDYVYDFYVPETYALFKTGLPNKIFCKIDVESDMDGIVSLNACSDDAQDDNHHPLHIGSVESYYSNDFNVDRLLELQNDENQIVNDQDDTVEIGSSSGIRAGQFKNLEDEDEDSNDENNWRNDYPDEDADIDDENPDFDPTYDLQDYADNGAYFDIKMGCGDSFLASKFEDFELDGSTDSN